MKKHLKRPMIPKSWPVERRGTVFVSKPNPGPHSLKLGLPIMIFIKDMLGMAKSAREVKNILNENEVLVDGIRR